MYNMKRIEIDTTLTTESANISRREHSPLNVPSTLPISPIKN